MLSHNHTCIKMQKSSVTLTPTVNTASKVLLLYLNCRVLPCRVMSSISNITINNDKLLYHHHYHPHHHHDTPSVMFLIKETSCVPTTLCFQLLCVPTKSQMLQSESNAYPFTSECISKIQFTNQMKLKKKEEQSMDILVLLTRGNKIPTRGNTETKCGAESEGKTFQRLSHLGLHPRHYCGCQ